MDLKDKNRELAILEIIAESDEPVGSWHVVNRLEEEGISVSAATIGRMLNKLETQGYLQKHSIKGRTITPQGLEAIDHTYKTRKIEEHKRHLDELINSNVLHKFLQVLEARKAIERTTARLAAEHITDEELDKLSQIIERQQNDYNQQKSAAQDDIDFHRTIAVASRNEALYSLYMILSMMGQQSELFEQLRNRLHAPYMGSHRAIFEALKTRSPEQAEAAMAQHIDHLCEDVDTYWHEFNQTHSITADK